MGFFECSLSIATFSECYEIICIYCMVPERKKQALAPKSQPNTSANRFHSGNLPGRHHESSSLFDIRVTFIIPNIENTMLFLSSSKNYCYSLPE